MTRFRMLAIGLALSLGVSAPAIAQDGSQPRGQGRGGMMGGASAERLLAGIDLTADQKAKVEAIEKKFAPKQKEMRDAMMASREKGERPSPEAMAKMRETADEQRTELRAVLAAEQQVTFDANVKAMSERRRRPSGS
ncbi:MAG TPA: Spy/CpxP family protein refolding chaperone [Gemmatimonadaceae bacterium]|nr:Spy/CpxP family protein refolding chaperone [Gemmatimonadaceae bacterium]